MAVPGARRRRDRRGDVDLRHPPRAGRPPRDPLRRHARRGGTTLTADQPPLWVIGEERGPRAALRAELIERGYDAVGFETLRDAVLAGRLPGAPRPVAVVVDLPGQAADARLFDALFALGAPVLAVAGAAEENDPRLRTRPWARWLRRPITLGTIADAVEGL